MEYECPVCGEWLEVSDFASQTHCPGCQEDLLVSADGEFVDGMWRDKTKLIKAK